MANKIDIKFTIKGVEYSRQISVATSKAGATGNVYAGDKKTGFFRWNKDFECPMFFSAKKGEAPIKGGHPLNMAIKEAVKAHCAELRKQRQAKANPLAETNVIVTEPDGSITCGGVPIVTGKEMSESPVNFDDYYDDEDNFAGIAGGEL